MLNKKFLPVYVLLSFVLIAFVKTDKLQASSFNINENVVGVSGLKTECKTAENQGDDYCKTQLAFQWTLFTGSKFGQLSLALWGGTDKHAHPKGICGLRFNGKHAKGEKDYIASDFTACFFKNEVALQVLRALLDETRFRFYEPKFNGKNRNLNFYTSEMGFLSEDEFTPEVVMGTYIHHIAVSSKRTSFKSSRYGHASFARASPIGFAKTLACLNTTAQKISILEK